MQLERNRDFRQDFNRKAWKVCFEPLSSAGGTVLNFGFTMG
jgi:hypothetical protein